MHFPPRGPRFPKCGPLMKKCGLRRNVPGPGKFLRSLHFSLQHFSVCLIRDETCVSYTSHYQNDATSDTTLSIQKNEVLFKMSV